MLNGDNSFSLYKNARQQLESHDTTSKSLRSSSSAK